MLCSVGTPARAAPHLTERLASILKVLQCFHGHRPSTIRAAQNLGDHFRLALPRYHVLHGQAARGSRKLYLIPAVHVDEVDLMEFGRSAPGRLPGEG